MPVTGAVTMLALRPENNYQPGFIILGGAVSAAALESRFRRPGTHSPGSALQICDSWLRCSWHARAASPDTYLHKRMPSGMCACVPPPISDLQPFHGPTPDPFKPALSLSYRLDLTYCEDGSNNTYCLAEGDAK